MISLKEDTRILELQARHKKVGSVVEICAFDILDTVEAGYEISSKAAVMAMYIFEDRHESDWRKRNPDLDIKKYSSLEVFENIMPKGERITLTDFLGEGYDRQTGLIDLFTYAENVRIPKIQQGGGLTHALLCPPYLLQIMDSNQRFSVEYGLEEQKRMTVFFNDFLKEVLLIQNTDNAEDLEIYKWSDDWSSYFDEGKEWWGTFYWSVLNKKRSRITIIAASATD